MRHFLGTFELGSFINLLENIAVPINFHHLLLYDLTKQGTWFCGILEIRRQKIGLTIPWELLEVVYHARKNAVAVINYSVLVACDFPEQKDNQLYGMCRDRKHNSNLVRYMKPMTQAN